MSGMRNDHFVKTLRAEHGNEGYAVYVLLLEIFSDECGQNPDKKITFFTKTLRKELGISSKKMELFLNFFQENSKLFWKNFGEKLEIEIPKLASLRDEYTKKSRQTPDNVPPYTEADKEADKDKEADTTPLPPSPEKQKSGGGSLKFLNLNIRGDRLREDEWLLRCWREQLHANRKNIEGCETLQALVSLHPSYMDKQRRWLHKDPEIRAGAIVYAYVDKSPDDPFKYALTAAEASPLWEKVLEYARQMKPAIEAGDYEVNING